MAPESAQQVKILQRGAQVQRPVEGLFDGQWFGLRHSGFQLRHEGLGIQSGIGQFRVQIVEVAAPQDPQVQLDGGRQRFQDLKGDASGPSGNEKGYPRREQSVLR